MPLGQGAKVLDELPDVKYKFDPTKFFSTTEQNEDQIISAASPGAGKTTPITVPRDGVGASLELQFVGSVVVATAAAVPSDQWPYNLMSNFNCSINGADDLWGLSGIDLRCLDAVATKGWTDQVDVFPGDLGGGGTIAVGTHPITLTWHVPLSIDPTTMVGCLLLQSEQANVRLKLTQALNSALFTAATEADVTITGTWLVTLRTYKIPVTGGTLILPDLSMLHGVSGFTVQFSGTGKVTLPLVKSAGQLERLFISARSTPTQRLSFSPSAAADVSISAVQFMYAMNKVPLRWNPASLLLAANNRAYGLPLPYDRVVIDTLESNPIRDAIVFAGLTTPKVQITVNKTASLDQASGHLVQEVLY